MRKIGLLFCALLGTMSLFGQSYPTDREKFAKTLQLATQTFLTKEDKDFLKDELEVNLKNLSFFPDAYFNQMVATCNAMETKKMKAYPDIFNYVYSVHAFVKNKQPQASFTAWHASVDKLMDGRNQNKFKDFIELSAGFFSNNLLVKSSNSGWYFYGEYAFEYTDKPFIKLTNGRLVCGFDNKDRSSRDAPRFEDSITIYNISGTFDPILKKWEGKGGKIDWLKVGLKQNETFAELKRTEINMRTNDLNADSVSLTSPFFPGKKVLGKLTDQAFNIIRDQDKTFPKFISYEKRLSIKNIKTGIDYVGGFSLQGAALIGLGSGTDLAQITISRNGKPFMKVSTQYMSIDPERIRSNQASVIIYVAEKDSVTHPGLTFYYNQKKDSIELVRGKTGVSASPFFDSYHQLQWYIPKMCWQRSSSDLIFTYEMGTSQEQRIARFESYNYYDGRLYDRLQGLEQNHPLAAIASYCYKFDEYNLTEGKAATALGKTIEQAKPILLELSGYGFISYDTENKMVYVNKKLDNFVQARNGKRDYDNIVFISDFRPKKLEGYTDEDIKNNPSLQTIQAKFEKQSRERNFIRDFGSMNLSSMELNIVAVDRIVISDPQASFIIPDSSKVSVKKNRDFDFKGWANFGKYEVHTLAASYSYEKNKVNLMKTDKSYLRVKPFKPEDGTKSIALNSALNDVTGEVIIDDPANRNGLSKTITKYPLLKSIKPAKIYYNQKELFKGAYDSTKFYYTVAPFEMDSLDNYSEKNFELQGELTSAGIFPTIKQPLKIMPDYSLGFSTKAPDTGYPFYGTSAKFNNKIVLSNNGLQGAGKIDFVQSTSTSIDLFTFLPDSTVGFAKFINKPVDAGVEFPDAETPEAYITYVPKKNVLKAASTRDNDIVMFDKEVKFKGTIIVQPDGMKGQGIANVPKAALSSDAYSFKRWIIDSDDANFNLKNIEKEEGESPIAMRCENVNAHVSFKNRVGEFKNKNGATILTFDVIQYRCKMDVFTWLMDTDSMKMSKFETENDININSAIDVKEPNFVSIHPDQDSLKFNAPVAFYSNKIKTMFCTNTEYIDVADARIYPDRKYVVIRRKAVLDTLTNARIVANYVTKYHTILNSKVQISARRKYVGEGFYPYFDADSNKTLIKMNTIGVDSSFQTFANGNILSEDNFKLSSQFDYYGKMSIKAAKPEILFTGATRINHTCEKFARNWMSFSAQIDPKNIQIPVSDNMKTLEGKSIAAGIVWRDSPTKDSIRLYPTFLSSMENEKDPILITSSGVLQYDYSAKEFQIGDPKKLINRNETGNFLALHTESCALNAEGTINLGMDLGDITVDAVGIVDYNPESGETNMNTTIRLNLPMNKDGFESLAERIVAFEGSKPVQMENTTLEMAMATWSNRKTADKFKSDYTLSEDKKVKRVPDEFEKSIVLTGVRLKSLPVAKDENGFISSLEGAAIVNMYGKPCMRQIMCRSFLEQNYSLNGDHFTFMIQIPGGSDYLMDYSMVKKDGTLNLVTNDGDLSSSVNGIKEDKRKTKNFLYQISTNSVYLGKLSALY